jgi:hypothetical protein
MQRELIAADLRAGGFIVAGNPANEQKSPQIATIFIGSELLAIERRGNPSLGLQSPS